MTPVYPGSLDPITFGHIGAIRDTAESFGKLVVALGVNPSKTYMFSLAEREALARAALADVPGVTVTSFSGLLVHFLVRNNLEIVVRGLRNGRDLDDAMMQEAIGWQQAMAEPVKAFYVAARPGQTFVSSTALKQVLKEQGDATLLAPASTIHATQARMLGQYLYGVTGASGAGKSTICRKFEAIATRRNIPLFHVDLDKIGQTILSDEHEPLYQKTRNRVKQAFGAEILDENGHINRKKLGEIVFGSPEKLKQLNALMHEPIFFRMNDHLRGKRGIFLVDSALWAETSRTQLVNHHVLLVQAKQHEIHARLAARDNLSPEQIARRTSSQFTSSAKAAAIRQRIQQAGYGHLHTLTNGDTQTDAEVETAFETMLRQVDIYGELRITGFFRHIGVINPEAAYTYLRRLYSTDDRFYHSLAHIVRGLNLIPDFRHHLEDPDALTLAWLFHDAVYDPHQPDNEEASAALLGTLDARWGIPKPLVARAKELILATRQPAPPALSGDARWIADLDISILGRSSATFDAYERDLRREYHWVSAPDWATGRARFLSSLQPPYFRTDFFKDTHAEKAEKNLRRRLTQLS